MFQPVQIFSEKNADDFLALAVVHGHPGIEILHDPGQNFIQAVVHAHREHVDFGRHDVAHRGFTEFDDVMDEGAFLGIDHPFSLSQLDHGPEFFVGDGRFPALQSRDAQLGNDPFGQPGQDFLEGADDFTEQVQGNRGKQGIRLRELQGHAFGHDFSKNEQEKRSHPDGDPHPDVAENLDGNRGGHDGSGDVHQLVSDVDGDEQFPGLLQQVVDLPAQSAFAGLHFVDLKPIQGEKRGFTGRKKA